MRILLTGGSGFIGKNILENFTGKYEIIAPKHLELDLLDEKQVSDFFEDNIIDVVIHSACKPGHRNAKDLTNLFYCNTRMYFNLARHSEKYKKMIVLGSGAIYDTRLNLFKVNEDFYKYQLPVDEHGFCKYVCARDIEKSDNIIELRLFGVFGKYEDYSIRFISNAICKALLDMPITLKQNRVFDYLYIDDLMPILDYVINHEMSFESYNVTPDNSAQLHNLAEIVLEISQKDLPIITDKPGLGLEYSGDNERLHKEIPELKFTELQYAIIQLYQWYLTNKDMIDKSCLMVDK
jgi:GDP-L-fucose synthase